MAGDLPTHLGRYEVIRRLGAGGMAEVFLAKSKGAEGIEKVLVVKRVLPSFARSAKFISMFIDEAKVAMRLNHPNIVQVYAFEQVKREFLLAMEFVDGLDLGRLVGAARRAGKRIPHGLCAYIVQEVARGLDYAHRRKDASGVEMEIVHRDVSPQNVLLTYEGIVKVADFGIAKAKMVSEETGVIKGKFAYMSPEQARGEKVDRRSDVYSLGILLAELLMNRSMYPGQHGLDVLDKVRDGDVTLPRSVDPDVPRELERIVKRALSQNRDDRYNTSRVLSGALTQFLHLEEQVWDSESLEGFIREVAPRQNTSPEAKQRAIQTFTGGATVFSGVSSKEVRERRRVVIVAGRVRSDTDDDEGTARMDSTGQKVLEEIGFKADAVLSWPDGKGTGRFRYIVGLGKSSVSDPLRATRIATDLLDALDGLAADSLAPVRASIGMSRGMVSTVRDHDGRLLRYAPVGNVLDVAERLSIVASAEEILVAGDVYRLVRRDFAFDEEVRTIDVSTQATSTAQELKAWLLRSARTQEEREADFGEAAPDLVGRRDEVDTLRGLWGDVVDSSRTQFAAVVGDLGVGKTALIRAAIEAFDPAARVLRCECAYGSADVPYYAVKQLLRMGVDATEQDPGPEIVEKLESKLRGAVGDHAAGIVQVLHRLFDVTPAGGQDDEGDRSVAIRRAMELLVRTLAKTSPVTVWIDGLQWADAPSLELLSSMRQRAYEVPCLVLMSTRPVEHLEPVFRGIPRIELDELGPEDREALVSARFATLGGRTTVEVAEEVLNSISARAGGNPFFLIELVDALFERDVVRIDDGRVHRKAGVPIQLPTTLEGVIAARLDELSEAERVALRWLAAAGSGMTSEDLRRLAGADLGPGLSGLVDRNLLEVSSSGAYSFPNAVVRQVAYEATDLEDRVNMHRRIAQHLSQSPSSSPGRIARHLEQAGERDLAAESYLDAALAALAVYSNREALRFFGKALILLPPEDQDRRFRVHEGREQILRHLGRPHEQLRELEAMRSLAARGGGARRRAIALLRFARFDLDNARIGEVDDLLPQALEAARLAGDVKLELDALRLEAEMARNRGEPQRALEACDQALERAGTDPELLSPRASILVQKGILHRRMGHSDAAFEAYAEAIVIFRRLGIRPGEAFALNSLGVALAASGAYEDAIIVTRASIHIDRETGDRLRLGRKLSNVGQLYDALGDTKRGLAFVKRALDVFEAVDDRAGRCDALAAVAEMMLDSGADEQAITMALDQAKRIAERLASNYEIARERLVRTRLERAQGHHGRAESAARRALEAARADGLVSYEVTALCELAAALAALGSADALEVARNAEGRFDGVHVERIEKVYLTLARAFAAAGALDESRALLAKARHVLDSKAALIRSSSMRRKYLESREAQAIRSEA